MRTRGEGVKKPENYADVINGSSFADRVTDRLSGYQRKKPSVGICFIQLTDFWRPRHVRDVQFRLTFAFTGNIMIELWSN